MPLRFSFKTKAKATLYLLKRLKELRFRWLQVPRQHRKGFVRVVSDALKLLWRYNCCGSSIIPDYFRECLWRRWYKIEEYATHAEWARIIDHAETDIEAHYELHNKDLSWAKMHANGIPVVQRLGVLAPEGDGLWLHCPDGTRRDVDGMLEMAHGSVFIKPNDSWQGIGCARIETTGDKGFPYTINGEPSTRRQLEELVKVPMLAEENVRQHEVPAAFHPASLNTMRFLTIRKPDGEIVVNRVMVRVGVGDMTIDNWCSGGLAIRVDEGGRMDSTGWYEDGTKLPCTEHPDTHIPFGQVTLPFYKESYDLVLQAHRLWPELCCIGWDVALTPTGPIIIESNMGYGLLQPMCGGIRKVMDEYLLPQALEMDKRRSET